MASVLFYFTRYTRYLLLYLGDACYFNGIGMSKGQHNGLQHSICPPMYGKFFWNFDGLVRAYISYGQCGISLSVLSQSPGCSNSSVNSIDVSNGEVN